MNRLYEDRPSPIRTTGRVASPTGPFNLLVRAPLSLSLSLLHLFSTCSIAPFLSASASAHELTVSSAGLSRFRFYTVDKARATESIRRLSPSLSGCVEVYICRYGCEREKGREKCRRLLLREAADFFLSLSPVADKRGFGIRWPVDG